MIWGSPYPLFAKCIDSKISFLINFVVVCAPLFSTTSRCAGGIGPDIMNLECTCRALSSDVVSARAIAEKARRQRTTDTERRMAKSSLHENGPEEKESMPNVDNGTTGGEGGKTGIKGKEKATQNTAKDQAKEKTKSTKRNPRAPIARPSEFSPSASHPARMLSAVRNGKVQSIAWYQRSFLAHLSIQFTRNV